MHFFDGVVTCRAVIMWCCWWHSSSCYRLRIATDTMISFFLLLIRFLRTQWTVPDATAFATSIKGTVQPAIIELVRDGGSYRVLLLDSMTMVNFSLAGLQCPRVGKPAAAQSSGTDFMWLLFLS